MFLQLTQPRRQQRGLPAVLVLSGRSMVSLVSVPIFFSSSLYALQPTGSSSSGSSKQQQAT
jgi:hypothetical protein